MCDTLPVKKTGRDKIQNVNRCGVAALMHEVGWSRCEVKLRNGNAGSKTKIGEIPNNQLRNVEASIGEMRIRLRDLSVQQSWTLDGFADSGWG